VVSRNAPHRVLVDDGFGNKVWEPRPTADSRSDAEERRVDLVAAATVRPERTTWALEGLVPIGGVTLLAGQEGLGKSTITVDISARGSRGQLEGDLKGEPIGVVYASAEDSWSRTLVPRLTAAGADLERIHFVQVDGLANGLSVPGDLDMLAAEMRRTGSRLLVLDPLGAHLHGTLDTHKDAAVRQALAPLAAKMDLLGAAAIGIMHWSKAPTTVALDRVNGSRAFTAAARAVLVVGDDPEDPTVRVLLLAKSNLGRLDVPARRFRIEGRQIDALDDGEPIVTSGIAWLGERAGLRASDLLAVSSETEDERSELGEIADLLLEMTVSGSVTVADAKKQLAEAGFEKLSDSTLKRARRRAGIEVSKPDGFGGQRRYFRSVRSQSVVSQKTDRTDRTEGSDRTDRTVSKESAIDRTTTTDLNRGNGSLETSPVSPTMTPGSDVDFDPDGDVADLTLADLDRLPDAFADDAPPPSDDDLEAWAAEEVG